MSFEKGSATLCEASRTCGNRSLEPIWVFMALGYSKGVKLVTHEPDESLAREILPGFDNLERDSPKLFLHLGIFLFL